MPYELVDLPEYTMEVAKFFAEKPAAIDNCRMLAYVLGCSVANAVACFGLMAVEKSGRELPIEFYERFFEPTPDRRELLYRVRQWYLEGVPMFD